MRRQIEIVYRVRAEVELETGLTLPPGDYWGAAYQMLQGESWTSPEYKLKLTADQISRMSGQPRPGLVGSEFNVTGFVRSGAWGIV
jgi:hypothetical protein